MPELESLFELILAAIENVAHSDLVDVFFSKTN